MIIFLNTMKSCWQQDENLLSAFEISKRKKNRNNITLKHSAKYINNIFFVNIRQQRKIIKF